MYTVVVPSMTVPKESWHRVRSVPRARRRLKRGHRQNILTVQVPDPNVFVVGDTIYCHPAIYGEICTAIPTDTSTTHGHAFSSRVRLAGGVFNVDFGR